MAGAATVDKALDLLFHLHAASVPLGLTEIGRDLALPKSSCHRLLGTLVDREIVERDASGRYRPGLALLSLGLGAQAREPVVQAARPVLEAEAARFGETVFLVAKRGGRLRVLDKVEGAGFLRAAPEIGDHVPEDVTAVGQLYAAFGHEGGPSNMGSRDPVVVEQGYAVNRDRWIAGLSVLATPIGSAGTGSAGLTAALALGAPSARFDEIGSSRIAGALIEAAHRIESRLVLGGQRVDPGHEPEERR